MDEGWRESNADLRGEDKLLASYRRKRIPSPRGTRNKNWTLAFAGVTQVLAVATSFSLFLSSPACTDGDLVDARFRGHDKLPQRGQ
jgi:hypothetical protein